MLGAGTAVAARYLAWTYDLRLPVYQGAAAGAAAAAKGDTGEGWRPPLGEGVSAAVAAMGFDSEDDVAAKKKKADEERKKKSWGRFFGFGGGGGGDKK